MCSDSGYITSGFRRMDSSLQEKVRADTEHRVLLFLDKHSAHLSLEAICFCCQYSIHLIILLPYSSYKIQPLEICLFKPLKLCYADECNKLIVTNPGRNIIQYQFCKLFGEAYQTCSTLQKATNAFRSCGI
jgi:hypothetical protein